MYIVQCTLYSTPFLIGIVGVIDITVIPGKSSAMHGVRAATVVAAKF
jgi:hypothetical protein